LGYRNTRIATTVHIVHEITSCWRENGYFCWDICIENVSTKP
jgi:hypothetical protein